jgi:lysine N6-hydroxylase
MTVEQQTPHFHTAGVGAGPANLSLAALFEAVDPDRVVLYEAQAGPAWHGGLLFPGVRMQTGWVKDLVSLVDPGHRVSFLSYLVRTRRVFTFLSAQYAEIPRLEYVRYLEWSAQQLSDVHFGTRVDCISFDNGFSLYSAGQLLTTSDHLVLGTGSSPRMPPGLAGLDETRMCVADHLLARLGTLGLDPSEPIGVAGGGQTGAECVLELHRRGFSDIHWFGRRPWFAPLDDSPAANEMYRPAYAMFLNRLPNELKRDLVKEQVLTSDGVSASTLRALFQLNYEDLLRTGHPPVTMLPGRRVTDGEPEGRGVRLSCTGPHGPETHDLRFVVVAAGRKPTPLPFDEQLQEMVDTDAHGDVVVDADYSVRWKGQDRHRIFAQNRARFIHGLPDANLSLLPTRSAVIINSLFGREVFDVADDCPATIWD